ASDVALKNRLTIGFVLNSQLNPPNHVRQRSAGRFAGRMGFFDRFSSRKPEPVAAQPAPAEPVGETTVAASGAGAVKPRLAAAREKIESKDLAGAMSIYEDVLASAGDRPDVLVAISGDLGSHGHLAEIIELIAPR